MKNVFVLASLLLVASVSSGFTSAVRYVKEKDASSVSRLLVFPVANKRAVIGSFWGAARDGGRKHKGIDIFARKGTPVVAVTDGIVSSVGNGGRGGKTVWVRSFKHPWTAYYAHLDQQKVRIGQFVKKGQVLGTVGNTGNAKTTPAHLHFGIYTWSGAINPLPYVKNSPKIVLPKPVARTKQTALRKKKY
jgi:murein DD-endopeptidase MepM/ murein hydrolase activator NlpD